jgi:vesicle-fusing ATPase
VILQREDFEFALQEVKPSFGITKDEFENCKRNGIIRYGPRVDQLLQTGAELIEQVRNSPRTPLLSILLEGPTGCGKTALAAELATSSGFPYVKLISPEMFMGYSESSKCARITKIFEDSYRSPLSCIVVDNIERMLEYTRIGPRFSNQVLQTLMVLLKTDPPKFGHRLLVICTSVNIHLLQEMELTECFSVTLRVPQISSKEEFTSALK